jgi:uncharacterized protein involved in outer membrane biogenesis
MTKSLKISLLAVSAFAALLVLFASVAAVVLRANAKPRLETIASQALSMEVRIGGPLAIHFVPALHATLTDVHVRHGAVEIASAAEVTLGIEPLPLLHGELRPHQIGLKRLAIAIERDRAGKLDVDAIFAAGGTLPALAVTGLSVSDATFAYTNQQSGEGFDATACNLDLSHLSLSSGRSSELWKNLSFAATIDCRRIRTKDFDASDLKLSINAQSGKYTFSPVTMQLFGGHGSGDLRADLSGSVPMYQVHYRLPQFHLEEFFRNSSPKSIGSGLMDFSATLSLRGSDTGELVSGVEGEASLHGNNLTLAIGDLDAKLSRYESSQSFNLIDFGAFFFAGPLGLAVTKGYNYARIFEGAEGATAISTLASEWKVEHGVAQATDVAMATQKNRVALRGGLDFVSGRYDHVTVAVIDARGCAIVQQKVDGPFLNPVLEKPNVLGTLTGPARNLLRQARNLLGGKCEVIYTGAVAPPK